MFCRVRKEMHIYQYLTTNAHSASSYMFLRPRRLRVLCVPALASVSVFTRFLLQFWLVSPFFAVVISILWCVVGFQEPAGDCYLVITPRIFILCPCQNPEQHAFMYFIGSQPLFLSADKKLRPLSPLGIHLRQQFASLISASWVSSCDITFVIFPPARSLVYICSLNLCRIQSKSALFQTLLVLTTVEIIVTRDCFWCIDNEIK